MVLKLEALSFSNELQTTRKFWLECLEDLPWHDDLRRPRNPRVVVAARGI
jgi:hypothetical protein